MLQTATFCCRYWEQGKKWPYGEPLDNYEITHPQKVKSAAREKAMRERMAAKEKDDRGAGASSQSTQPAKEDKASSSQSTTKKIRKEQDEAAAAAAATAERARQAKAAENKKSTKAGKLTTTKAVESSVAELEAYAADTSTSVSSSLSSFVNMKGAIAAVAPPFKTEIIVLGKSRIGEAASVSAVQSSAADSELSKVKIPKSAATPAALQSKGDEESDSKESQAKAIKAMATQSHDSRSRQSRKAEGDAASLAVTEGEEQEGDAAPVYLGSVVMPVIIFTLVMALLYVLVMK